MATAVGLPAKLCASPFELWKTVWMPVVSIHPFMCWTTLAHSRSANCVVFFCAVCHVSLPPSLVSPVRVISLYRSYSIFAAASAGSSCSTPFHVVVGLWPSSMFLFPTRIQPPATALVGVTAFFHLRFVVWFRFHRFHSPCTRIVPLSLVCFVDLRHVVVPFASLWVARGVVMSTVLMVWPGFHVWFRFIPILGGRIHFPRNGWWIHKELDGGSNHTRVVPSLGCLPCSGLPFHPMQESVEEIPKRNRTNRGGVVQRTVPIPCKRTRHVS